MHISVVYHRKYLFCILQANADSQGGPLARILVINPNSSVSVTRSMQECLIPVIEATRHEVDCTELPRSPPGIETDDHVAEVIPYLIDRVEENDADAIVVACFSDPGIRQVRDAAQVPVVGIAEAAYLAALGLGDKFGVVSLGPSSIDRQLRDLKTLKLDGRLAGDRSIGMTVVELMACNVVETIVRTGKLLRDEDGADVIILGCAGLGGYRAALEAELGVPVVDPVQAGVALACANVDLSYRKKAS
jgi:Asp/Glu/hydantoin racemase